MTSFQNNSADERQSRERAALLCAAARMLAGKAGGLPIHVPYAAEWDEHKTHLQAAVNAHEKQHGALPRLFDFAGIGVVSAGADKREADAALEAFLRRDNRIGGSDDAQKETASRVSARLEGKIALVTGGAQGFGKGIAQGLAAHGAHVMIADLNVEGAQAAAQELCEQYGQGRVHGIQTDVSDEASIAHMAQACALHFGGIDLLVSNAGILRSGGLEELSLESFELMTKVNYTAFFLCAKHVARIMKAQRAVCPGATFDIVQVNSKSGLAGSNRNFAYAGGKFGGLGLVQSFALELVDDGIKVNAVCPGNFYEGPLWADPETGLFVQYLKSGKVPGAQTIDDVRRAYEDKVPMKRGCTPGDVVRAILYAVEQQYETGQAIPVTGGQNMLR